MLRAEGLSHLVAVAKEGFAPLTADSPVNVVVKPVLVYHGIAFNISHPKVLAALEASIWPNKPAGVSVPLIELAAHGLLVLSITGALLGIALRRRTHKRSVADSWQPLPIVDVPVRFFTVVAAADLIAALLVFVIMCLPVLHDGAFATCVYAGAHAASPPLDCTPQHARSPDAPPRPRWQCMASSTMCRGSAACTAASQSRGPSRAPPCSSPSSRQSASSE